MSERRKRWLLAGLLLAFAGFLAFVWLAAEMGAAEGHATDADADVIQWFAIAAAVAAVVAVVQAIRS